MTLDGRQRPRQSSGWPRTRDFSDVRALRGRPKTCAFVIPAVKDHDSPTSGTDVLCVTSPRRTIERVESRVLPFGIALELGRARPRHTRRRPCAVGQPGKGTERPGRALEPDERSPAVLNDAEVKRIIDAITEYRELVQQSSEMRDQLESLQKRWAALKAERDGLRTRVDALHQTLAQMKVDYQAVMKRMTDLSSTEDTVLDNVKFLIDELSSVLKKHEA